MGIFFEHWKDEYEYKKLYIVFKTDNVNNCLFEGIFDSEEKALKVCKDNTYFIGPVELNKILNNNIIEWPNAYYPKRKYSIAEIRSIKHLSESVKEKLKMGQCWKCKEFMGQDYLTVSENEKYLECEFCKAGKNTLVVEKNNKKYTVTKQEVVGKYKAFIDKVMRSEEIRKKVLKDQIKS